MNRFRQSPLTLMIIGVNVAFFLAENLYRQFYFSSLFPELALTRSGLAQGCWWQLVTYAFLHGNLLHLGVNMVALWFTGPLLEELLGAIRYIILYFGGALAGGLLQTFASPEEIPLVGASGAICALLVGFATLLPRLQITALIFFVIPVRMRAAMLGWLVIAGSMFCWYFGIERGIGHLAHLGGGIAGFLLCRIFIACGYVHPFEFGPPPLPKSGEEV